MDTLISNLFYCDEAGLVVLMFCYVGIAFTLAEFLSSSQARGTRHSEKDERHTLVLTASFAEALIVLNF